jgi:hypothetical protein
MVTLTILDGDRLQDDTLLKMLQTHQDNENRKDKKKGGKGNENLMTNKIA